MTAILYQNARGKSVSLHSYSGGSTFRQCAKKYEYDRLRGWRTKEKKASTRFGEAIEAAIQYYHTNGAKMVSGVAEFKRLWAAVEQIKDTLTFTDKEGDWNDLYRMGSEMMALYEVRFPSLGISWIGGKPRFQVNYRKEVFPGSNLAGIEFTAYADMLGEREGRRIIVDIKTSANPYHIEDNLLRLDPQLRSYAWVSGIPDVAFLVLVKARPGSFKKGDEVSMLVTAGGLQPGQVVTVLTADNDTQNVTLLLPKDYEVYEKEAAGLRGKALDAKKNEFGTLWGVTVPFDSVTKQRIQFLTTSIPEEDIREAGESIGQEIVNIHHASSTGCFPKNPSVRFPDTKCTFCDFLPLCVGDEKSAAETLVQITETKDAIEELFA